MPTPYTTREIDRLTEGWPAGLQDLELTAFAAAFRSGRPELSAPALDRIGALLDQTLDRQDRWTSRRRIVVQRCRRLAPLSAAAAAVVVGIGICLHFRAAHSQSDMSRTRENSASVHGTTVLHPTTPSANERPAAVN